jgi:hypothetical protein
VADGLRVVIYRVLKGGIWFFASSSWCNAEEHSHHEHTCTDMGVIEVGAAVYIHI